MKTLEQIFKQEAMYLNNWESCGRFGVIADFEEVYMNQEEYLDLNKNNGWFVERRSEMNKALEKYSNRNILFASYGTPSYEGYAFVLFEEGGKLYEVNGSHCSCYGLENQFEPEEVSLEALEYRLVNGNLGMDDYTEHTFAKELCEFLGVDFTKIKK